MFPAYPMFGKRIATGADFINVFQPAIRILRANSIKVMRCVQSHDTQRFRVRFPDSQLIKPIVSKDI